LKVKSIAIWPMALVNVYIKFFGRRKTDLDAVVMLLDLQSNSTNVVINRHRNLLFARSIPIGTDQLGSEESINKLVLELNACKQQFGSIYRHFDVERMVFLSGNAADKVVCASIAKQMAMPAQMGDCLAAVEIPSLAQSGIDRRDSMFSWATAFGLSMS
jgi:hypothetical protein